MRRISIVLFAFLSGCAATGVPFATPVDPLVGEAVVYVYRLHNQAFRNVYPKVYINGEERGPLKNEGFLVLRMPPGPAELAVKGDGMIWVKSTVVIKPTLAARSVHFFRYSVSWQRDGPKDVIRVVVESVPREQALAELKTTRMSE